jgi:hypothetical protein
MPCFSYNGDKEMELLSFTTKMKLCLITFQFSVMNNLVLLFSILQSLPIGDPLISFSICAHIE